MRAGACADFSGVMRKNIPSSHLRAKIYSKIYLLLMKHILQITPDVLFPQSREVSIDISRCSDVRVTKPLLDIFQLPSIVIENAGCAMTNIVETHFRQSMPCENLLECAGEVIRTVRLAVAPDKNIIRFL